MPSGPSQPADDLVVRYLPDETPPGPRSAPDRPHRWRALLLILLIGGPLAAVAWAGSDQPGLARHAAVATLDAWIVAAEGGSEVIGDLRRRAEEERQTLGGPRERPPLPEDGAVGEPKSPAAAPNPALAALAARVGELEARLAITSDERDQLQRSGHDLRRRMAMLETQAVEVSREADQEAHRMRRWIAAQAGSIQAVLAGSGIDVDQLLRHRDDSVSGGQGGPYHEADPLPRRLTASTARPVALRAMNRLEDLTFLMGIMPLAAPLSVYRTTSTFGVRHDPLTGKPAIHAGLDFGGPKDAPVLATAPGAVVVAGALDAYGLTVEIDHGMGIQTRYAHLKSIAVVVGERVASRKQIGVMGSTGRSTAEHVHYEVRVDGAALNPALFLAAGRQLRSLL